MKVTLISAISANGKITKNVGLKGYGWLSLEDKKILSSLIEQYDVFIMGRKTYLGIRNKIKLETNKLRIVLTSEPEKYNVDKVPDKLEFSSESPEALISRLNSQGYDKILLLGGGKVNSFLFKLDLIDELHLTIEPRIFGKGKNLVSSDEFETKLKLIDFKKLNDNGTLYLIYKIEHQ
jgi:dihydrofolate reductase